MNKRQKKKAYKKKYGHNPKYSRVYNISPSQEVAIEAIKRTVERVAKAIRDMVPVIKKMIEEFGETAKETVENIKTMPEEDFNRLLESSELDEKDKALARQIRSNG